MFPLLELLKNLFRRFRRIISFGAIGLVNTGLDFLVYTICYSGLALSPRASQAAGYVAGVLCSFILNRTITFRDGTRTPALQILLFVLVNAVSFAVTSNLIGVLVDWGLNSYIAKAVVTAVSMFINYFGYKIFVFKVKKDGEENRA